MIRGVFRAFSSSSSSADHKDSSAMSWQPQSWSVDVRTSLATIHKQIRRPPFATATDVCLAVASYYRFLAELVQTTADDNDDDDGKEVQDATLEFVTARVFPYLCLCSTTTMTPTTIISSDEAAIVWTKTLGLNPAWLVTCPPAFPPIATTKLVAGFKPVLHADLVLFARLVHLHSLGNISQIRRAVLLLGMFLSCRMNILFST
jgi:hypothetical protein